MGSPKQSILNEVTILTNKILKTIITLQIVGIAVLTNNQASAEEIISTLDVPGVTCVGTALTAQEALKSIDGVKKVVPDSIKHEVLVLFDDEKCNEATLKEKLKEAGLDVKEPATDSD